MNKKETIEYLSSLSAVELGDIVNEVSSNLRRDKEYENGDFEYCDILCLAICSFGSFEGKRDDAAIVELYSKSTGEFDEREKPVTEQSSCDVCKVSLVSNSKQATCPICHTLNELT